MLIDRDGLIVALAGKFDEHDTNALAGLVSVGLVGEELADRMLAGESVLFTIGTREALISIAGQIVFVVAIVGASPSLHFHSLRN